MKQEKEKANDEALSDLMNLKKQCLQVTAERDRLLSEKDHLIDQVFYTHN